MVAAMVDTITVVRVALASLTPQTRRASATRVPVGRVLPPCVRACISRSVPLVTSAALGVAAAVSRRRNRAARAAAATFKAAPAAADRENPEWRAWATKLGISAPKVDLHAFSDGFGADLRGMAATESIESDEPIIQVPASSVLQVTTGCECPLGDEVDAQCWGRLPWWAQLALLLVRESQRGQKSSLSPWIESLPKEFPSVLLTWSDADLAMLEYPPLVERTMAQRDELANAYAEITHGCRFPISEDEFRWAVLAVRSRAFSGPYEGRDASDRVAQVGFILTLLIGGIAIGLVRPEDGLNGALLAAISIPLTDFIVGSSAQLKRHVVCPVVDYLNHDSNAVSDIAYEYFGDAFAVRVRGGFKRGEQVCINYGETRSNDALLQYYGFVERDCPHDVYSMDLLSRLDDEAAAAGETLWVDLGRSGPDERGMDDLCSLLASGVALGTTEVDNETEALAWRAVSTASEAELQRPPAGDAHALGTKEAGVVGVAARFRAEKEKVLLSCRAHAEARRGRPASVAPLSLVTRSAVIPTFEDATLWRHSWAEEALTPEATAALRNDGYCVLTYGFDPSLARRCLEECESLDGVGATTATTNRCNRGSRSCWLELGAGGGPRPTGLPPALHELSEMLAGLPQRASELQALGDEALRVHAASMVAVYPERAAEYVLHKDSYAPADNDPATGATRRLTVLAYLNEWQEGDGGELRLHEAAGDKPDARRFYPITPIAGCVVLFDSRRQWHAVAPALRGPRWAVTVWAH